MYVFLKKQDPLKRLTPQERVAIEKAGQKLSEIQKSWKTIKEPSGATQEPVEKTANEKKKYSELEQKAQAVIVTEESCQGDCLITRDDIASVLEWVEIAMSLGSEHADELMEKATNLIREYMKQFLEQSPCRIVSEEELKEAFKDVEIFHLTGVDEDGVSINWLKAAVEEYIRYQINQVGSDQEKTLELAALARLMGLDDLFVDIMNGTVKKSKKCSGFYVVGKNTTTFKLINPVTGKPFDPQVSWVTTFKGYSCNETIHSPWVLSYEITSSVAEGAKGGPFTVDFTKESHISYSNMLDFYLSENSIQMIARPFFYHR